MIHDRQMVPAVNCQSTVAVDLEQNSPVVNQKAMQLQSDEAAQKLH